VLEDHSFQQVALLLSFPRRRTFEIASNCKRRSPSGPRSSAARDQHICATCRATASRRITSSVACGGVGLVTAHLDHMHLMSSASACWVKPFPRNPASLLSKVHLRFCLRVCLGVLLSHLSTSRLGVRQCKPNPADCELSHWTTPVCAG